MGDAQTSAARDLFSQMGGLFTVEPAGSARSSKSSETMNTQEMEGLLSMANDATETLASPFMLSDPVFTPFLSPELLQKNVEPVIKAAADTPKSTVTPALAEAPKMTGSLPRFPTPDSLAMGLSPGLSPDSIVARVTQRPASPSGSTFDVKAFAGAGLNRMPVQSPPSGAPASKETPSPPTRQGLKSFASMRFRSRSVGQGDISPPRTAPAATAIRGLGLAGSSPPSSHAAVPRGRRASLSTKLSRVFTKSKNELETPPMPASPPNRSPSPVVRAPNPSKSHTGLSIITSSSPGGLQPPRAPSPLSMGPRDGVPSSPVASVRSIDLTKLPSAAALMPNVPTASPQVATSAQGTLVKGGSSKSIATMGMFALPAASSALFGASDGPYAVLANVGRPMPTSPVEARPQISIRLVEPVSNRSSAASSMAPRPKRSSSMVTDPNPLAPEVDRLRSASPVLSKSPIPENLSPTSAYIPRVGNAPALLQPVAFKGDVSSQTAEPQRSRHVDIGDSVRPEIPTRRYMSKPPPFLEPPGLQSTGKAIRRLSSLSSLPDRLAEERRTQQQQEQVVSEAPKQAQSRSSMAKRRRSSLSYLQPLASSPSAPSLTVSSASSGSTPATAAFPSVPSRNRVSLDTVPSSEELHEGQDSTLITISPSSSMEHVARVLENGMLDSADGHSEESEPVIRRPSTRIFNLVTAALGADFIPASPIEKNDQLDQAESRISPGAHTDEDDTGSIVHVLADGHAFPLPPDQSSVNVPESDEAGGGPLDSSESPSSSSTETDTAADTIIGTQAPSGVIAPNSVNVLQGAAGSGSLDSVKGGNSLKAESVEMDSNERSISGVSASSSFSEAASPIFDRSRRDSSESAPPSELEHAPKTNSEEQNERAGQEDIVYAEPGDGRPWATGKSWTHELSLEDPSHHSSDSDASNPINSFDATSPASAESPASEGDDDPEGDAYSSSDLEESDSDADARLDESLAGAVTAQRKAQTVTVGRAMVISTKRASRQQQRNPFNFLPNGMQKRDRRGNIHPLPVEPELPIRAPSPPASHIGHPLLPQTDEHVRLRTQRSLARLTEANGQSSLPSPISPTSPELPPFVQESVLAIRDQGEAGPSIDRAVRTTTERTFIGPPPLSPSEIVSQRQTAAPQNAALVVQPIIRLQPPPPGKSARPNALRILFEDHERCAVVQTHVDTTIANIMSQLAASGHLPQQNDSVAHWALFEQWSDLGIERPLREYELIREVLASWPQSGADNKIIAKPTKATFARLCSARRVPQQREHAIGHFVRVEVKRGKWEKRWLALDDLSITAAKSEKGKEKQVLCTMANWDVYLVPSEFISALRPPHTFAFALKSTDPLDKFSSVDKAIVYLSCKTGQEAETWYSWLSDARSRHLLQALRSAPGSSRLAPPTAISTLPPSEAAEERARAEAAVRSTVKRALDLSGASETRSPLARKPAPIR